MSQSSRAQTSGSDYFDELHGRMLADFQHACNQANVDVVQRYWDMPRFVDQLKDEQCTLLMATAIHSAIYGHPRAYEIMNLLSSDERFLCLGPLGTVVVEKAMASGNDIIAIHILSHFEVEEASAGQGLVAAAKSCQWKATEALFLHHDNESIHGQLLPEDRAWVIQFETGALRDFLKLTSEQGEFRLFWKAVEVARETGSVDLEQFLLIIDQGMAASQTFDQLAVFVNLLMNDPYEYAEYLDQRRDLGFPFAGQLLRIFQARNIILDETGVPDVIGNLILDQGLNDAMYRILERSKDKDMPIVFPSSSHSSHVDQVNETIDEVDDAGTVDLSPTIMSAPIAGNNALSASPAPLSQARAGDIDLLDASAPKVVPQVPGYNAKA